MGFSQQPSRKWGSRSKGTKNADPLQVIVFVESLSLQRHFSVSTKFTHVESRFCGRKQRGKAAFDVPVNLCVRSVCSKSVAVGLSGYPKNFVSNNHRILLANPEISLYCPIIRFLVNQNKINNRTCMAG